MPAVNNGWRDRQLYLALCLALPVWGAMALIDLPAGSVLTRVMAAPQPFLLLILVYPILEEIVFRGGVQGYLRGKYQGSPAGWLPGKANVITSLLFSAFHLVFHAPLWAIAVFVPSLVFGYFRDRHDSLAAPIVLHCFYNSGYFLLYPPL